MSESVEAFGKPVESAHFRATMSRFATCVTVTTTAGRAGPVGCTTTAVLSLSVRPPTLLLSLSRTSCTLEETINAGAFAVNVLSVDQEALVRRFATGDPLRRFAGVPHSWWETVPVLDNAAATVVCDLRETVPLLDHTLLVGAVRHSRSRLAPPLVLLDGHPHTAVAA